MADYYVKIKGTNYDGKMVTLARSSVKGKGDGRISLSDAKKILRTVKDSADYTDIEKKTMKYIRDNYAFTAEADAWFRTQIRKWAAAKGPVKKTQAKKAGASKPAARKKNIAAGKKVEEYQHEDTILLQKAGMEDKYEYRSDNKSKILKIALIVIIILIIIILALFLSPAAREWIKTNIYSGGDKKAETEQAVTPSIKEAKKTEAIQIRRPPEPKEKNANFYEVQVKDDLVSISQKLLNNYSRWKELYEANREVIKDPNLIYPGQKLKIPSKETGKQ